MKKFNLFAVAFVAVFTQSVNANNANEAIGANIGSEDNAVRIIEEARPEAAPRGIFVSTKEARPEVAPRDTEIGMASAPRGAEVGKGFRGAEIGRGFRGVEIGRGFRGAEVGRGFRGAETGMAPAPRNAEMGKGMAWPMA
ncbi:MAG: hypothetical protein IJ199_03925 [Prevotella sp.]|nr:hypothetical protein [Prevotella sp.]